MDRIKGYPVPTVAEIVSELKTVAEISYDEGEPTSVRLHTFGPQRSDTSDTWTVESGDARYDPACGCAVASAEINPTLPEWVESSYVMTAIALLDELADAITKLDDVSDCVASD